MGDTTASEEPSGKEQRKTREDSSGGPRDLGLRSDCQEGDFPCGPVGPLQIQLLSNGVARSSHTSRWGPLTSQHAATEGKGNPALPRKDFFTHSPCTFRSRTIRRTHSDLS